MAREEEPDGSALTITCEVGARTTVVVIRGAADEVQGEQLG